MPLVAPAVAVIAADEARKAIGDGIDQLDQGGPNYIRDGQPQSIMGKVGQAIARAACRRYAENPSGLSDSAAAGYEKACRPYLNDTGYGTPPSIAPPFDGGQCPGVAYAVDCQTFNIVTGQWGTFTTFSGVYGPITAMRIESISQFNQRWVFSGFNQAGDQPLTRTTTNGVSRENARFFNLRRQDGQPDGCGNPAPVVDPVDPPPAPTPNPEPFNPDPTTDVDIEVDVDVDGRITVNIGTGPVTVDPFADDNSGIIDPDVPGGAESGPTNPGGNGGFGGDDMFGEPPAGRRWAGCCITITERPQGSGVIPQSVPEDVYPTVVGNLRLVASAAGSRVVDTPVRIMAKKVCVWEPVRGLFLTGINVDLLPGFGYTYTPYSVPLEN